MKTPSQSPRSFDPQKSILLQAKPSTPEQVHELLNTPQASSEEIEDIENIENVVTECLFFGDLLEKLTILFPANWPSTLESTLNDIDTLRLIRIQHGDIMSTRHNLQGELLLDKGRVLIAGCLEDEIREYPQYESSALAYILFETYFPERKHEKWFCDAYKKIFSPEKDTPIFDQHKPALLQPKQPKKTQQTVPQLLDTSHENRVDIDYIRISNTLQAYLTFGGILEKLLIRFPHSDLWESHWHEHITNFKQSRKEIFWAGVEPDEEKMVIWYQEYGDMELQKIKETIATILQKLTPHPDYPTAGLAHMIFEAYFPEHCQEQWFLEAYTDIFGADDSDETQNS